MATSIDSDSDARILFIDRKLAEIREQNPNLTLIEQMRELLAAYKKEYNVNPEPVMPTSSAPSKKGSWRLWPFGSKRGAPTTPTSSSYNGKRMCLRSDDAMDVDA